MENPVPMELDEYLAAYFPGSDAAKESDSVQGSGRETTRSARGSRTVTSADIRWGLCSGPVADPGHPRMARAIHGWPGVRDWPGYNSKVKKLSKQLSIRIFIVPKSEVYEEDEELCADSPPTLQFAM